MSTTRNTNRRGHMSATALGVLLVAAATVSTAFATNDDTASLNGRAIDDLLKAASPASVGSVSSIGRAGNSAATRVSMSAGEVYRMVKSGIARIVVRSPIGGRQMVQVGTGFLIDGRGDMVTDCHVVRSSDATGPITISVAFADDQVPLPASIVGCDEIGDIAVVHVDRDVSKRRQLQFAKAGTFEPGDGVVEIGYELNLYGEPSVKLGAINALHRFFAGGLADLVQTDAMVNHGDSGGPLLDMHGDVVGVISGSYSPKMRVADLYAAQKAMIDNGDASAAVDLDVVSGMNFARSAVTAQVYAQKIIAYGKVERPDLGIEIGYLRPAGWDLPRQGVVVKSVKPGSQAELAGLNVGDIIYAIDLGDGTTWPTPDTGAFKDALALMKPGVPVKILHYTLRK